MLIHRSQLNAMHACTDKDTRYFMNAVAVMPDGTVAGTDGHVLIQIAPPENETKPDADDCPPVMIGAADAPEEHPTLIGREDAKRLHAASKPTGSRYTRIPVLSWVAVKPSNGQAGSASCTDLSSTTTVKALDPDSAQFPNISRVIPSQHKATLTIRVDAHLLKQIAEAAIKWDRDANDGRRQIPLDLRLTDATSVIRVDSGAFMALLMPMRLD